MDRSPDCGLEVLSSRRENSISGAYASRLRVSISRLKKKRVKTDSVQEQTSDQKLNKFIADLSQFLEGPVLDFVVSQISAL